MDVLPLRKSGRPLGTAGVEIRPEFVDDRLGRHEITVPRRTVRDELITQLTQSPSTTADRSGEGAASEPDTFAVKPARGSQNAVGARLNQHSRPLPA
ncbi:hypothetical protein D320_13776 [Haloferax sp. BAB-2207]|nr:hypothetical protein D320_13776 [Haloferax sp. BAB-2207]